jgi:2-aminoethylphosphonate-pyruvate transaminase
VPPNPQFDFERFYEGLSDRGFIIYRGALENIDSFQISWMGQLTISNLHQAITSIREVLAGMGLGGLDGMSSLERSP